MVRGEEFMYQNVYSTPYTTQNGDRFFFPFLTGALVGGAAVGLTRPRPIYNVAPYQNQPYPPYGGGPYGYSSYSYYYPYGR